jgi:hypothetical protein
LKRGDACEISPFDGSALIRESSGQSEFLFLRLDE